MSHVIRLRCYMALIWHPMLSKYLIAKVCWVVIVQCTLCSTTLSVVLGCQCAVHNVHNHLGCHVQCQLPSYQPAITSSVLLRIQYLPYVVAKQKDTNSIELSV